MAQLCLNFDKLPIKYQEETKKLSQNVQIAVTLKEKRELFKEFTKNYTMLPALWIYWLGVEREAARSRFVTFKKDAIFELEQKALNDFYYWNFMERKHPRHLTTADFWFYKNIKTFRNCYDLMLTVITESPKESKKLAEMFLSFPHKFIDSAFKLYQQVSVEPVSKAMIKKYKFNKNLYQNIMAVNDSDEKWLELIKSVKDFEFFRQNIETRIAENPTNKNLWKFYIEYLKDHPENFQILLSVYFRYCRLFIDDEEMKAEFEKAELKEKRKEPKMQELLSYHGIRDYQKTFKLSKYTPTESCPAYFKNYLCQYFAFPNTILLYLMDNISLQMWHILFKSCKYFFHKYPNPIFYNLRIISGKKNKIVTEFEGQSLTITAHNSNLLKCKNAILSNTFELFKCDPIFLSKLISTLYSSKIKFLHGGHYRMTLNEFNFLVGHGKVEIAITEFEIVDAEGKYIPIEDLVAKFPNARQLQFCYAKYNENSAWKLSNLQRFAKLEQFKISFVTEEFNVNDYINFSMKNALGNAFFEVKFVPTIWAHIFTTFKDSVNAAFIEWKNMKPYFLITA